MAADYLLAEVKSPASFLRTEYRNIGIQSPDGQLEAWL